MGLKNDNIYSELGKNDSVTKVCVELSDRKVSLLHNNSMFPNSKILFPTNAKLRNALMSHINGKN